MSSYPDLASCGIYYMRFSFHLSGGLDAVDAFWEERGLPRPKERLMFAGYSRSEQPHTVYLHWERSHEECCDVYLGVEARRPSKVWPQRPLKQHLLREKHLREFIVFIRELDILWGIRAKYAYRWVKPFNALPRLPPHTRIKSFSFEVFEEDDERSSATFTLERQGETWFAIIEPTARFPLPEGGNFFAQPFEMGCMLSKSVLVGEQAI